MSTYTPIATQTLTSAVSSITFTGIPQTYTDLIIVAQARLTSGGGEPALRFNNETSTLYSATFLEGYDTTQNAFRETNQTSGKIGFSPRTEFFPFIVQINDYSSTTKWKTSLVRHAFIDNSTPTYINVAATLFRSTVAINEITLLTRSANYDVGSTFSIYGIAAGSPKAQGGQVTTDGTYWYHTFKGSGLFSTYQALTVDYLVIAGGAGGSAGQTNNSIGAGGGAGGLRSTVGATGGGGSLESALSLNANTDYAITVGAGGPATLYPNYGGISGSNSVLSTITSIGGGGGGGNVGPGAPNGDGVSGGSGGAGRIGTRPGGSGTANQGYAGGAGGSVSGGGGGGTGGAGGAGSGVQGGAGGAGVSISTWASPTVTGVSNFYAGGGGGGSDDGGSQPSGGAGGGGAGSLKNVSSAGSGTVATGSGGGGGAAGNNANQWGGNGGSGLVIVRYAV
jgi:hypothetical protein